MARFVESAVLRLVDQASDKARRINREMEKLHRTMERLNALQAREARQNTNGQSFDRTAQSAIDAQRAIERMARAMDRAASAGGGRGAGRGFEGIEQRANRAASAMERLQRVAGSVGAGIGGGLKGLYNIDQNLDKLNASLGRLSRKIRILNRLSAAMRDLSSAAKMDGLAGTLKNFERLSSVLAGSGPAGRRPGYGGYVGYGGSPYDFSEQMRRVPKRYAAYETVRAGHSIARHGGIGMVDGSGARTALSMLGAPKDIEAAMIRGAARTSDLYRGISEAEMIEIGKQAYSNLKSPEQAEDVMRVMGRTAQAMAINYRDAKRGTEAAYQFYRAADIARFAEDPTRLAKFVDAMSIRTLLMGRDINPRMVAQSLAQTGSQYVAGWNRESIGDVVSLSDELRGQVSRNLRSFYYDLTRSNLADGNVAMMQKAGLRGRDSAPVDGELLFRDPYEWTKKYAKGYMTRSKADGGLGLDLESMSSAERSAAVSNAVTKMGFLGASGRAVAHYILSEDEIERNRRASANIQNTTYNDENLSSVYNRDLQTSMSAFSAQYQKFIDHITRISPNVDSTYTGTSGLQWIVNQIIAAGADTLAYGTKNPMAGLLVGGGAAVLGLGKILWDNKLSIAAGLLIASAGMQKVAAAALMTAAAFLGPRTGLGMMAAGSAIGLRNMAGVRGRKGLFLRRAIGAGMAGAGGSGALLGGLAAAGGLKKGGGYLSFLGKQTAGFFGFDKSIKFGAGWAGWARATAGIPIIGSIFSMLGKAATGLESKVLGPAGSALRSIPILGKGMTALLAPLRYLGGMFAGPWMLALTGAAWAITGLNPLEQVYNLFKIPFDALNWLLGAKPANASEIKGKAQQAKEAANQVNRTWSQWATENLDAITAWISQRETPEQRAARVESNNTDFDRFRAWLDRTRNWISNQTEALFAGAYGSLLTAVDNSFEFADQITPALQRLGTAISNWVIHKLESLWRMFSSPTGTDAYANAVDRRKAEADQDRKGAKAWQDDVMRRVQEQYWTNRLATAPVPPGLGAAVRELSGLPLTAPTGTASPAPQASGASQFEFAAPTFASIFAGGATTLSTGVQQGVSGAAGSISGALSEGGASVAAQIRSALATPVTVNVNAPKITAPTGRMEPGKDD